MNFEVYVRRESYLEILGFTTYAYITNRITKYSGMAGGRVRTLGEFIENFVYGKVAEEAFKLFLNKELALRTLTEVDVADFYSGVYLPDVVAIEKNQSWEPAKFWVDVKEVRRDQKWLLIPASSIRERPYDAYVAVWVGLPDDHILWLIGNLNEVKRRMSDHWLKKVDELTKSIEAIPCKICGFATWNDVLAVTKKAQLTSRGGFYFDGNTALFDPDDNAWSGAQVGENVGFELKRLGQTSDWKIFHSLITQNKRIISAVPMPRTKSGQLSKKSGLPSWCNTFKDFRDAYQAYFEKQLKDIEQKFRSIERTTSWFAQTL
jgi:hypothetical protein